MSGREFSGGFAECCLLNPGTGLVRLPDTIPDTLAAPANCAVATVASAYRLSGPVEGGAVAILGSGVLGLTACAMAASMNAEIVIACDIDPQRADMAREFGATHFCEPSQLNELARDMTKGRGADCCMEFSGATSAVSGALAAARVGGTAIIAGTTTPGKPIPVDPEQLVRRMLTIKGLHNYAPCDLLSAIDFLSESLHRFSFSSIQGGSFSLESIEDAFATSATQSGMRTAVIP